MNPKSISRGAPILAVTLNPSIDVSATTQTVTTEHKLRSTDVRRDAGGGAINVARVLKRLGADCQALYPEGGFLGRLLRRLLEEDGVSGIALDVAEETRESFTVLERASGREFRFVLPGPHHAEAEWQACLDRVAAMEEAPKPNLRELRELTGWRLETEEEWAEAASGLVEAGRAQIVALSLGHRGGAARAGHQACAQG